MNLLDKIKLTSGMILSIFFMFLDFNVTFGYRFYIHLGPFIVGIILVSLVMSMNQKLKSSETRN